MSTKYCGYEIGREISCEQVEKLFHFIHANIEDRDPIIHQRYPVRRVGVGNHLANLIQVPVFPVHMTGMFPRIIFDAAYMILATIFIFVNMAVGMVFTILFLALFVIELRTDRMYLNGKFPKARVIRQNEKTKKNDRA